MFIFFLKSITFLVKNVLSKKTDLGEKHSVAISKASHLVEEVTRSLTETAVWSTQDLKYFDYLRNVRKMSHAGVVRSSRDTGLSKQ